MSVSFELGGNKHELLPDAEQYKENFLDCKDALEEAFSLMHASGFDDRKDWKPDYSTENVQMFYRDLKNGRYFVGKTVVPIPMEECVKVVWDGIENCKEWNDTYRFSTRYKHLSTDCDIGHYGTNKKLIVDAREFVVSRIMHRTPQESILAAKSTKVKELSEGTNGVRAQLYLSAARFRPNPSDTKSTLYDYMTCVDMKGMMLKSILNPVLGRLLHEDVGNFRKLGVKLRAEQLNLNK